MKYQHIDYRPWGYYTILQNHSSYKLKHIFVYPNQRLSLQSHQYRQEYWLLLNGSGNAQLGEEIIQLQPHNCIYIPINTKHRLINTSLTELLIIMEVQVGSILIEEDIIRYEDDYQRIH
jgi:mannose-6-phosphate isomerase-like protein (cupin superfamily)